MNRSLFTVMLGLCLMLLVIPVTADDTPAKPAWDCLPANTVAAMRIPHGKAFADALKARTQLGAVMFSDERMTRFLDAMKASAGEEWDTMVKELERYDLATDDLPKLFEGPMGGAVVMVTRKDPKLADEPMFVALAWAEPGVDLATRGHAAFLQVIEDQMKEQDNPGNMTRVDMKLAGHDVSLISSTEQGMDYEAQWEFPENFEAMTEEQMEAHWEAINKKMEEAKLVDLDKGHTFITRMGGRLVIAATMPQSGGVVREHLQANPDQPVPWDALTGVEELTEVFARFLTAHGENEPGFAQKVAATPGIDAAMVPGDVAFEMYFDVDPVMDALQKAGAGDPESETVLKVVRDMGVTQGHVGVYRMTLDQAVMRGGLFFGVKGPRAGLMQLLDQEPLASEPPAWVSSDVEGYAHIAFDLEKAYSTIKAFALQTQPEQAPMAFMQIESTVENFTGVTLPDALKALGNRHTIVTYETQMVEVDQVDWSAEPDPATGEWPTKKVTVPQDRVGMVWQLRDEAVFGRLMQALGNFAPNTGGMVKPVEEQGFKGFRMDAEQVNQGLMMGRGYLAYGIGSEVTERLMAMLRNTPEERNRLANSERYNDAKTLVDLRPGVLFQIEDAGQTISSGLNLFLKAAEMTGSEQEEEMMKAMVDLLPTPEEIKDMVSTSVGLLYVTENGLHGVNAVRLAPAK